MNLYFIGSSNAVKPYIILENLLFQGIQLSNTVYLTDSNCGVCVDFCKVHGISVMNILNYTEEELIERLKQDNTSKLLVSLGWPKLISAEFLKVWDAAINCHGSVLPDYRGSRSYMHYWANMASEYGASIHYMNDKFDDGNVIVQGKLKLYREETQHIIHQRTAELCAYLLPRAIELVQNGYLGYKPAGRKRYFYKMSPEEFEEHRRVNEELIRQGLEPILTKHKEFNE